MRASHTEPASSTRPSFWYNSANKWVNSTSYVPAHACHIEPTSVCCNGEAISYCPRLFMLIKEQKSFIVFPEINQDADMVEEKLGVFWVVFWHVLDSPFVLFKYLFW